MASCSGPWTQTSCWQRALGGVIAIEGLEGADLDPASEQIGRRRAAESADVVADERDAAEAEVEGQLRAEAHLVPGGGVVAGPGEAVALAAGIGGARHHEGTLVGTQLEQPFVGGALVLHAEDVVNLGVRGGAGGEAGLVDAVNVVERHGEGGAVEDGRLVHVVPEAGDAVLARIACRGCPTTRAFARA